MVELIKESIMNQYVIYKKPRDYPKKYVTRKWEILVGGLNPAEAFVCDTLKEARGKVPDGLVQMERSPEDDPAIYEVWI